MFRLTALGLLVVSVAVAAPVPKVKEAKLYYPTTIGAKRIMVRTSGPVVVETVQEIIRVDEKDGIRRVTVAEEEINHLPAANGRPKPPIVINREFALEVSGSGLFRPPVGGTKDSQPLLDLTAKPGASWKAKGPGDSTTKLTYTMGKEEEVEVPAGRFTALRVEFECGSGDFSQKDSLWYARGVGLIKIVSTLGKGREMTTELKAFTPGEAEKKDK